MRSARSVRVTPRSLAELLEPRADAGRGPAIVPWDMSHPRVIPGNSNKRCHARHEEAHAACMNKYDVVVVGGGAAGLSAALVLARARRRVAVIDAGEPRNAPAAHMQGFLSRDGMPPADLLAAGPRGGHRLRRRRRRTVIDVAGRATMPGLRRPAARATSSAPADPGRDRAPRRAPRHPRRARALGPRPAALPVLPRLRGPRPAARRASAATRRRSSTPSWSASGPTTSCSSPTTRTCAEADREALIARAIGVVDGRSPDSSSKTTHLTGVELADGRVVAGPLVFVRPRTPYPTTTP